MRGGDGGVAYLFITLLTFTLASVAAVVVVGQGRNGATTFVVVGDGVVVVVVVLESIHRSACCIPLGGSGGLDVCRVPPHRCVSRMHTAERGRTSERTSKAKGRK